MSRRIPRPEGAVRVRLELSPAELAAVEDVAHLCRLSVASFVRVAMLDAAGHPERKEEWSAIAARLTTAAEGAAEPPKKRGPKGRPKKGSP